MTAQKGQDLTIEIKDENDNFVFIAGLRARTVGLTSGIIDVTDSDSNMWRHLLSSGGIKSCSISGDGIFKDEVSQKRIKTLFFNGLLEEWRIGLPEYGTLEGVFQIVALRYNGRHDDALQFDITLESANEINFISS
jgi:TP901-1 family phage major tail protein